jgi:hypothetical protein
MSVQRHKDMGMASRCAQGRPLRRRVAAEPYGNRPAKLPGQPAPPRIETTRMTALQ